MREMPDSWRKRAVCGDSPAHMEVVLKLELAPESPGPQPSISISGGAW